MCLIGEWSQDETDPPQLIGQMKLQKYPVIKINQNKINYLLPYLLGIVYYPLLLLSSPPSPPPKWEVPLPVKRYNRYIGRR